MTMEQRSQSQQFVFGPVLLYVCLVCRSNRAARDANTTKRAKGNEREMGYAGVDELCTQRQSRRAAGRFVRAGGRSTLVMSSARAAPCPLPAEARTIDATHLLSQRRERSSLLCRQVREVYCEPVVRNKSQTNASPSLSLMLARELPEDK